MKGYSRRIFLRNISGTGFGLALAGTFSYSALGANETVRLGIFGLRSRGANHLDIFSNLPGVQVCALCDVDEAILHERLQTARKLNPAVQGYSDPRQVLERKDIDAVVVATPNYWHALLTIWACQAGKDVYVEKPVSHGVWEGRKMVEASQRYQRVVQCGFQHRSDPATREAFAYIQEGHLGKVLWVHGLGYKRRRSIGKVRGPQKPPATVDYNLYVGPAALVPLRRQSLHYDWHWIWDTGNGDLGNSGVHEIDLARWISGAPGLPSRVISFGGRFGYEDDGQTPNTQVAYFEYASTPILFEIRGLPKGGNANDDTMDSVSGVSRAVIVHCENGLFAGGANGGKIYDPEGKELRSFKSSGGEKLHQANFIEAVRARNPSKLHAQLEPAHYSAALCHLANISCQLGTQSSPEEIRKQIGDRSHLLRSFESMQQHLNSNGVDLGKTPATLGPWLTMNPAKEQFCDDSADMANMFLRRNYRPPFLIPESI